MRTQERERSAVNAGSLRMLFRRPSLLMMIGSVRKSLGPPLYLGDR